MSTTVPSYTFKQGVDPFAEAASADPFAEQSGENANQEKLAQKQGAIHIRVQQRNGRKSLTTIQGVPEKYDTKKVMQYLRKKLACNGTIVTDPDMGEVIQLQGDQRHEVAKLITKKLDIETKDITIHGF